MSGASQGDVVLDVAEILWRRDTGEAARRLGARARHAVADGVRVGGAPDDLPSSRARLEQVPDGTSWR